MHVARQIANIFVAQRHNRARHENLAVILAPLQPGGKRQQRLARASLAGNADELNIVIGQRVQGERLLGIARRDAIRREFINPLQLSDRRIKGD